MKSKHIIIDGMTCGHCVMAVQRELSKIGVYVKSVKIGSAEIEFDESKISEMQIKQAIEEAGYLLRT